MVSIMSNCATIKDITQAIIDGVSADDVIPYDLSNFDDECFKELLLLYIKYGNDEKRKHACMKKYKEVI